MSRLLFRADGVAINTMLDPTIPPDSIIIRYGRAAIVQNVDDANVLYMPPRTDYARRYNVIPFDVTEDQAVAIFLYGWRRGRETAGGSYDDAGNGALSDKTAVLWGVESRVEDFRNWYNRWYAGTKIEFMPLPRREVEP